VDKDEALAGRVAIELPVAAADAIRGVSDEIERLAGEAGLRIMQAVMQAEVESLAGPKGRHESERPMTRWGQQGGYVVLAGKKVRRKRPRVRNADGGKALRKAVQQKFGERCPVQRCQLHKRRNVVELLAEEHQGSAEQRLRAAYVTAGHAEARRQLLATVAWLEKINPTAAASLREGLEETLTLHRLGVPAELRRSLCSTNLIESALSVTRDLTRRVKRWRDGDMRQRWAAAGLLTVEQRFRRVRGHKWMSTLMKILQNRRAAVATKARAA